MVQLCATKRGTVSVGKWLCSHNVTHVWILIFGTSPDPVGQCICYVWTVTAVSFDAQKQSPCNIHTICNFIQNSTFALQFLPLQSRLVQTVNVCKVQQFEQLKHWCWLCAAILSVPDVSAAIETLTRRKICKSFVVFISSCTIACKFI